jgi:fermentation-respiration switch protein FrsA (DUF1100 family)
MTLGRMRLQPGWVAVVAVYGGWMLLTAQMPASTAERQEIVSTRVVRRAVTFDSDGETLRGWLYLPRARPGARRLPGIVTANALTAVKEITLPAYAERFAEAGYAVLIFDYRYWGASTGSPRFHVAPMEHRADISAALTFLAGQREVDAQRLGGWGVSMGGGHMLFLATWEPRLKAVVVTSTGIDPPREDLSLSVEAARARYDALRQAAAVERAGRAGAGITVMDAWCLSPRPGCVLAVPEAYKFYERARSREAPMFANKLTSTSLQNLMADNVTFALHLAHAPILIVHPVQDVIPVEHVLFWFKRATEPKRLVVLPGLHTSTYTGGRNVQTAADEALAWFRQHL